MFQKPALLKISGDVLNKVYDRGWAAKSTLELEKRIRFCLKKIDQKFVQDLALTTRKRLDRIARKGIEYIFFQVFLYFKHCIFIFYINLYDMFNKLFKK